MKSLLLDYVRLLPILVLVALCGILFAYAIGTQESQLAVVAFVPGLSLYIFTQTIKFAPTRDPSSDALGEAIKKNLNVAMMVTSVALFFSVNALMSAALYQVIGITHAASICFRVFEVGGALTVCMLVSAVRRIDAMLSPNRKEVASRAAWRPVLACLLVTLFAIPASFSQHSHNYSHIS
jgi:hypothetical protein